MPTILGLAGVETPASMDGRSLAHLIIDETEGTVPQATRDHILAAKQQDKPWRQAQLIEYMGLGNVVRYGKAAK